ncbi:MAG: hypothetical protein ACR2GR_10840 [Rhodothermales bacterium]
MARTDWGLQDSAGGRSFGLTWIGFVLSAALLLTGCETSFEAFEASDQPFSLYGYLDSAADTQFIRVSPLRDSLFARAAPLDVTLTLEHVASGRTSVWRDSLFRFRGGGLAHNFWSQEPIEPSGIYRMTISRPDGAGSTALVQLPPDFPTPTISVLPFAPDIYITTIGVERLAEIRMTYHLRDVRTGVRTTFPRSFLDRLRPFSEANVEGWSLQFIPDEVLADVQTLRGPDLEVLSIDLFIAAAGPDWPDLEGIDLETLALPETVKNVEGGVGYVGGIVSKGTWIYRQDCGWRWQCRP